MKLLLDSHAFLWWLIDNPRLTAMARRVMADSSSAVYVSAATVWELSVKAALGRLDLGDLDLADEIEANDFIDLPIAARHGAAAARLPRHHADPFDRVLIAQAELEGLTIVTRDAAFNAYGVAILPA